LACGTPVIGLDSGAIPEVVRDGETGFVVPKTMRWVADPKSGRVYEAVNDLPTAAALAAALGCIGEIERRACRADFERRFTLEKMATGYLDVYQRLAGV
jgi:glycosyltransferase involved in cell wall biosynthesis